MSVLINMNRLVQVHNNLHTCC